MTRRSPQQCDLLIERLSAYLDGDPGPEACDRIQAHARTCPRCAALVADLRRTVGICHKAARTPLPAPIRARARKCIDALLGPKPSRRGQQSRRSARTSG
jgi:anti-sigma factor RsiW